MRITPIFDAIETLLKEDARTKDAIKQYEKGKNDPEGWSYTTPVCIIGRHADIPLERVYLNDATGSRPRMERGAIIINVLGRAYRATDKYDDILIDLDTIQDNVFSVLNENSNLGGTVLTSRLERMYLIQIKDYFGFELVLTIKKMEG